MPDIVDPATRSRMMSGIKASDTKPELVIRKLLHRRGFRFRLHVKKLPGKPDIVLPKYRAVIQVNGCFWHGHDCHLFKWPSTRHDWWKEKIERNRLNDEKSLESLHDLGWRVATIWECSLKGRERLASEIIVDHLDVWLRGGASTSNLVIRGEQNEARRPG